jgi:hypothetical protein
VRVRWIPLWALTMVLGALFTSCAPPLDALPVLTGSPEEIIWEDVWVESIRFTVRRDLSTCAEIVVLQSRDAFEAGQEGFGDNQTILATTEDYWSQRCGFATQPYNASNDAHGFTAWADFVGEGELRRAMSCPLPLARLLEIHPLETQDRVLWTDYEFRAELDREGVKLLHSLSVTLPGKTEVIPELSSDMLTCENTSADTLYCQIPRSAASSGSLGPSLSFAAHSSRLNYERLTGALVIVFGGSFAAPLVLALVGKYWKGRKGE